MLKGYWVPAWRINVGEQARGLEVVRFYVKRKIAAKNDESIIDAKIMSFRGKGWQWLIYNKFLMIKILKEEKFNLD